MVKKIERKFSKKDKAYRRQLGRVINIGNDDIDSFLENVSLMLSVNVSLNDVLNSISREINNKTFRKVVQEIADGVNAGMSLSEAMRKTRVFKEYTLELVESGENSGKLLHNLELIVEQRVKERSVKGKIFSAMVYPIFVLVIGLLAGIAIFGFVLPRVTRVFAQLNLDLPWITRAIISFSNFLGDYGLIFIPAFISLVVGLFFVTFVFKPTKFIGQFFLLRTPILGRLIKQIELARLGFNLGTLLKAGIPVDRAVGSLDNLTEIHVYKNFYHFLSKEIQNGHSFLESFNLYSKIDQIIPVPVQNIIEAGEQSASLSISFDRIGEIYEKKTEVTTKSLITLLEPLLLFTVWIGVAGIALSIIVPIYSLIGNFGSRDYSTAGEQEIVTDVGVDNLLSSPAEQDEEPLQDIDPTDVVEYKLIVDSELDINLNVRSDNTTSSPIIFEFEPGSIIDGISQDDGWYEVLIPGDTEAKGWVFGVYVTETDDI